MKNSRGLILGEVVYIAIIYHIPDSWIYVLKGYDFSFDHMTGENRELESNVFVTLFATNFIEVQQWKKGVNFCWIFVGGSLFSWDLIIADQWKIFQIRDK